MKYTVLSILFALVTLASCIDDDVQTCIDNSNLTEGYTDGYAINFTVTLDKMGGNRAQTVSLLEERENYIDPEKFRVLFFDRQERFLFESKSRWVKQLSPTGDGVEWLVSVPMYTLGNDEQYNWNWEEIRRVLTGEDLYDKDSEGNYIYHESVRKEKDDKGEPVPAFKIAILVNRPGEEWCPDFDKNNVEEHWFDNSGPYWEASDTRWDQSGKFKTEGTKKIFDLHHCQPDPIYHAKNHKEKVNMHYYSFIQDEESDDGIPLMGSTSSWVEWKEGKGYNGINPQEILEESFPHASDKDNIKYTLLPTIEHPIPMYGVQDFYPIKNWVKGTPFNLSQLIDNQTGVGNAPYEFRSISLLRSVVKLELLIPKTIKPTIVTLWYSNIYARCEPMDVWTPTDQIWEEDHENDCEWKDIMNYGPVCSKVMGGGIRNKDDIPNFQKTMSWFYGAWAEKGPDGKPRWDFKKAANGFAMVSETNNTKYPHIFNTCIQRNKIVACNMNYQEYGGGDVTDLYNDDYYHYVVYTGERNINDPNDLPETIKNAYAVTWMFNDKNTGYYYFVPIADYSKGKNTTAQACFGPYTSAEIVKDGSPQLGKNDNYNVYEYGNALKDVNSVDEMPWPLLRNHVYTLTVTVPESYSDDSKPLSEPYTWDFTKLSPETVRNLDADVYNWQWVLTSGHGKGWGSMPNKLIFNKQLKANGQYIRETAGLSFIPNGAANENRINFEYDVFDTQNYPNITDRNTTETKHQSKYYIRLEFGTKITFPKIPKGWYITVIGKIPVVDKKDTNRWIKPVNDNDVTYVSGDGKHDGNTCYIYGSGDDYNGVKKEKYTFTWKVNTESNIQFELRNQSGCGLAFEKFIVSPEPYDNTQGIPRRASQHNRFSVKAMDYHSKSLRK